MAVPGEPAADARAFITTAALGALLVPVAFGLARLFSIDLAASLGVTPISIAVGIIATAPLILFLCWFMRSPVASIAAFRESQIRFLRDLGFRLTFSRNVLLSLLAGVSEELLFRGVLQTAVSRHAPMIAAILATNLLFGLLHARTRLYAVIAGAVGSYLGALYWIGGDLTAPILTHALYDFIALEWARRILIRTAPPT